MNKRGENPVMSTIVKLIPHLLLLVALLIAGAKIYTSFYAEKPNPLMDDLDRLVAQIEILQANEVVPVFVINRGFFELFAQNSPSKPKVCGKHTCICVSSLDKNDNPDLVGCRNLVKIDICSDANADKCDTAGCVKGLKEDKFFYAKGQTRKNVYICKSCSQIAISENEKECATNVEIPKETSLA